MAAPSNETDQVAPNAPDERLLTARQVAELLGISHSQLRNLEREGTAPKRLYLSPRTKRYRRSDVDAWLCEKEFHGAR